MRNDIDYIIELMSKYTNSENKKEFGEQEGGSSAGSTGRDAAEYPTVTKWESGVTRGPANQIGLTKWKDTVKINRGKANTLL